MKIEVKKERVKKHVAEALVIGMFQKEKLSADLKFIDNELNNQISEMIKNKVFAGEDGQTKLIYTLGKLPAKSILLVGLGKKKDFTSEKLRRTSANVTKGLRDSGFKTFTTTLQSRKITGRGLSKRTQALVEGTVLGLYEFKEFITVDKDKIKEVETVTILEDKSSEARQGLKTGTIISENINYVRDLINKPAEVVTPAYLAKEAAKIGRASKVKVKVFGKKEIEKMKMGGLLGVSKGSDEEPQFIVLEYNGGGGKPLVLVGKGITFDSGGLDIKPAKYMEDMRSDMAGAATVLGTIKTLNDLGVRRKVVGVIPACENMLGAKAYKQGDVLTTYNGKTIEVWHTDAEGRLILADALGYADKNYKAKAIVDIATLTGAAIFALGYDIAALMSSDEKLRDRILDAAKKTDEVFWELPLFDDYREQIKGDMGDVRNMAREPMGPGTITAGLFLQNFVEKAPWAHIDIGGAGWSNSDKAYKKRGGTGVCLRTFVQLIEGWK